MFEKARAEFALPETEVAEQVYRFAGSDRARVVFAHSVRSYLYAGAAWRSSATSTATSSS